MASKFSDGPTDSLRFADLMDEPRRRLAPLRGYEHLKVVSLEEATDPLVPHVDEIKHMVDNALENTIQPTKILSHNERASIMLYSMEWSPRENSFYRILNSTLRSANREKLLPPWLSFLRLFLTALTRLPSTVGRTVYRGVKMDLRTYYPEGSKVIWWGFSSCTSRIGVLENDQFFGKSGTRTLFAIECDTGKDIREYAFYPEEEEVLLLPGREFKVMGCLDAGNSLYIIQMKEIAPKFPNIAPITLIDPPSPIEIVTKNEPAIEKKPQQKETKKVVSDPKPPPVELSYESKKLTDADIQRVMNEALAEKKCTNLNLSWNNITHEGAAIIAKAIRNNKVRCHFSLVNFEN